MRPASAVLGLVLAGAAAGWTVVTGDANPGSRAGPVLAWIATAAGAAVLGSLLARLSWILAPLAVVTGAASVALVAQPDGNAPDGGPFGYANATGSVLAVGALAAAAIAAKESVGLAVAALGVWYAVRYRAPRAGAAIAFAGAAAALVAVLVVVPLFAPGGGSPFASRYDSPSLDGRDLSYLAALLLPLALVPLAAPLALLAALPELMLNVLSSTVTQTSVRTHYAATAIPALLATTAFGVARIGARSAYAVALAALAAAAVLGPLGRIDLSAGPREAAAQRALALVPAGAPVSATNALGAHLSDRERIFSFPVLREAEWVVVDERRLTYLDSLEPGRARPALAALRSDPGWRLVFDESGVLVFRRG